MPDTKRPTRQASDAGFRQYAWIVVSVIAVLIVTAAAELWLGRLPLGPDGRFGFWEGDIWSSEQSQRFCGALERQQARNSGSKRSRGVPTRHFLVSGGNHVGAMFERKGPITADHGTSFD